MVLFRQRFKVHARNAVAAHVVPARGADRAVEQGNALIRDDELGVDLELRAEACARRACAERVVEREHARRQLFDGDAAVLARIVLREEDIAVVWQDICENETARERRRSLARVRQAVDDVGAEDQAVDDDLDIVLFVLFEGNFLAEVIHVPVGADADIARAARVLENLDVLAFLPRMTGAMICTRVPSPSAMSWSMIWSMDCWRISLPQFGQCGVPTRAQSRRR